MPKKGVKHVNMAGDILYTSWMGISSDQNIKENFEKFVFQLCRAKDGISRLHTNALEDPLPPAPNTQIM